MFAKYVYTAIDGVLLADDLSDILTGETVVNNLSANCNKTLTTIEATVPAGWALHDSTGSNPEVNRYITSTFSDNAGISKYVWIHVNTGYPSIYLGVYETWDNVNHTGTNLTYGGFIDTICRQRLSASGGIIYLASNANSILVLTNDGSNWGDSTGGGAWLCSEYSRDQLWNTPNNAYPNVCMVQSTAYNPSISTQGVYFPRIKASNGSDLIEADASAKIGSIGVSATAFDDPNSMPTGISAKIKDADGYNVTGILPIWLINHTSFGVPIGEITSLSGIYLAPNELFGDAEIVPLSSNSNEYVALRASTNQKYLVKKA